MLMGEEE